MIEAQRARRVSQLPIAVVGGDHRTGAQAALDAVLVFAGDRRRRVEQGVLHLGDRRQGNLGRQNVVEHMIVAQISVGEDVIADRLARPQATAMADHQPHFRAQHRDVIAHGLGVRRPDADIDEGDAGAALGH